jgi:NhaB family Na+:H+ antiporter
MVIMALPYTVVLTLVGLVGIVFFVEPMTAWFYDAGWIIHRTGEAIAPTISVGH